MKRTMLAVALASVFATATVCAVAADTPSSEAPKSFPEKAKDLFKSKFSKADKDNDGTLDQQEAKAIPEVAAHFEAIDTDKDGTVSRDEIKTYDQFVKRDKDKDGTLDPTEAKGWRDVSKNFDKVDTDKDGTVSLSEVNVFLAAARSHSASTQ